MCIKISNIQQQINKYNKTQSDILQILINIDNSINSYKKESSSEESSSEESSSEEDDDNTSDYEPFPSKK
jgi:hypothetical protein